jgi:hypothetical protein
MIIAVTAAAPPLTFFAYILVLAAFSHCPRMVVVNPEVVTPIAASTTLKEGDAKG